MKGLAPPDGVEDEDDEVEEAGEEVVAADTIAPKVDKRSRLLIIFMSGKDCGLC